MYIVRPQTYPLDHLLLGLRSAYDCTMLGLNYLQLGNQRVFVNG